MKTLLFVLESVQKVKSDDNRFSGGVKERRVNYEEDEKRSKDWLGANDCAYFLVVGALNL